MSPRKRIPEHLLRLAYAVAKDVYDGKITRSDGIRKLVAAGENKGNAADYIRDFRRMMEGAQYERALNLFTTELFLDGIERDYGPTALRKACESVRLHVDYYDGFGNGKLKAIRQAMERRVASLPPERRPLAAPVAASGTLQARIEAVLRETARARATITYKGLKDRVGLLGKTDMRQVFTVLGAIQKEEVAANRPMLPAVVVQEKDGLPGPGFFRIAKEDLSLNWSTSDADFAREQLERVFRFWRWTPDGHRGLAWLVKPFPHNQPRADEFLAEGLIAIGWPDLPELRALTRDRLIELTRDYDYNSRERGHAIGNIIRFMSISPGDLVVVPETPLFSIGKVAGPYRFDASKVPDGYAHQYPVEWLIRRQPIPATAPPKLKARQTMLSLDYSAVEALARDLSAKPTTPLSSPASTIIVKEVAIWAGQPTVVETRTYERDPKHDGLLALVKSAVEANKAKLDLIECPGRWRLDGASLVDDLLYVFEIKSVSSGQMREFYEAVGQLRWYEYQLGQHDGYRKYRCKLVLCSTLPPTAETLKFLERHEGIACTWRKGSSLIIGGLAAEDPFLRQLGAPS